MAKSKSGKAKASASTTKKGTVSARAGKGHKQTQALYSRSQAMRSTAEVDTPTADEEAMSGKEKTSAAPPDQRARANREKLAGKGGKGTARKRQPTETEMEPEVPIGGREGQRRQPLAGESSGKGRGDLTEDKRAKREAQRATQSKKVTLEELIDLLPVGTTVEVLTSEVRISAPIAGGSSRVFHGVDFPAAIANMRTEMEEGPASLVPAEGQREAMQFDTTGAARKGR